MWNRSIFALIMVVAINGRFGQCFSKRGKLVANLLDRAQLQKKIKLKESELTFPHEKSRPLTTGTRVVNGWSYWSEWGMCSKTCGDGKMYRKRLCLLSGAETDVSRCNGISIDNKFCSSETHCPINGGWTLWSSWSCSVTCGTGQSVRFRQCTNPVPSDGGADCTGSTVDEGKCWMVDCSDVIYTLSPKTNRILQERVNNVAYSYVISKGKRVILHCNQDVANLVHQEFPNSITVWTKNGDTLEIDSFRAWMNDENFIISYAYEEDTGLYECRTVYSRNVYAVISVVSLVVRDEKSVRLLYKGQRFQLRCPCSDLSVHFPKLTRRLLLNKFMYDNENGSCVEDTLELGLADSYHDGEWRCHVVDEDNGRIWVTNVVDVKVLPARSWIREIWDSPGYFIAGVAIWFVFSIVFGGVYSHYQRKRSVSAGYISLKRRMGSETLQEEQYEMNPLITTGL